MDGRRVRWIAGSQTTLEIKIKNEKFGDFLASVPGFLSLLHSEGEQPEGSDGLDDALQKLQRRGSPDANLMLT